MLMDETNQPKIFVEFDSFNISEKQQQLSLNRY